MGVYLRGMPLLEKIHFIGKFKEAIMIGLISGNRSSDAPINLSKGAKINLSKETALHKVMVGLGWDCNKYDGSADFDLDASVFMVGTNGRTKEDGFIFYNNLSHPSGSVVHQGDDKVGGSGGDDERIYIDLDIVPEDIQKIAVVVTIFEADKRRQNFGLVSNSFCRLVNTETDKEEIHFDLGEDFSIETGVTVCEFYRHNGDWKFSAIGKGFSGGLLALCNNYGLQAEYR